MMIINNKYGLGQEVEIPAGWGIVNEIVMELGGGVRYCVRFWDTEAKVVNELNVYEQEITDCKVVFAEEDKE